MGPDRFWFFRFKSLQKCKNFEIWTIFRYCKMRSKFYYITRLCDLGENSKIDFFKFFTLNYVFIFNIINLHKKCDLLRYIMLLLPKKCMNGRGSNMVIFLIFGPLQWAYFLSYNNIIYFKRSHFL